MTNQEKILHVFMTHFERYVQDRIISNHIKTLNTDGIPKEYAHLMQKIEVFIANMVKEVVVDIFEKHHEDFNKCVSDELGGILREVLTDKEAEKLVKIASDPAMQKILRNVDLIASACDSGFSLLGNKIAQRCLETDIQEKTQDFFESLTEEP